MYNRIAIIGAPSTGKTTLGNNLSKIYNIPVLKNRKQVNKWLENEKAKNN